jgi:dolichol kinase
MEGTLAMFFAASAAMTPVLALLGGMDWHPALALAMIGATVAAGVESVSPYGSDGFTVPLATAFTLCLLVEIS